MNTDEIRLEITPADIEEAKKVQQDFDSQKTYNKFNCNTNYIGYLGELVFNRYLKGKDLDYKWIQFNKQGWNEPDFIINDKKVDLKTTFSDVMWMQDAKHDIYIYAQINKKQTLLKIKGWMSKTEIDEAKYNNKCKVVVRNTRKDYVFEPLFMNSVREFLEAPKHEGINI